MREGAIYIYIYREKSDTWNVQLLPPLVCACHLPTGILFPGVLFSMVSGLQLHFSLHISCVVLFKRNQSNPPHSCVFSLSLSSCEINGRKAMGNYCVEVKGKSFFDKIWLWNYTIAKGEQVDALSDVWLLMNSLHSLWKRGTTVKLNSQCLWWRGLQDWCPLFKIQWALKELR